MKKLIITILIIFAYGIPQVFAVNPPMNRHLFWYNREQGVMNYFNSRGAYVNASNQFLWYINNKKTTFKVTIDGRSYTIDVKKLMTEAFNEWAGAFTPPITFKSTSTPYPAKTPRVWVSINTTEERCSVFPNEGETNYIPVLTNYRGSFESTQAAGVMVFYAKCFQKLVENIDFRKEMKEATGKPNMTPSQLVEYMTKYYTKRNVGYLFGLGDTVPTTAVGRTFLAMTAVHIDIHNVQQLVYLTHVIRGAVVAPNDPVSIMVGNIIDYFTYLHVQLTHTVNYEDINVTDGDRLLVRQDNTCPSPYQPNLTQQESSNNINCSTSEITVIITSHLANNTARTTALTSQA